MVRSGTFREDLWYRINVFPLAMPPLRDRPEDIPKLARHFAKRAASRFGLPEVEPHPDDMLLMISYRWPGNIRELAAVIDRAVILGEGTRLDIKTALGVGDHDSPSSAAENPEAPTFYEVIPEAEPALYHRSNPAPLRHAATAPVATKVEQPTLSLDDAIRVHIEKVLTQVRGKIEGPTGAAALLQINPHTLRAKMRKLKIDWARFRES